MDKQYLRNLKSLEKLGKKNKLFTLDKDTLVLFDQLSDLTGKTHIDLLREAMQDLGRKYQKGSE